MGNERWLYFAERPKPNTDSILPESIDSEIFITKKRDLYREILWKEA